MNEDIIAKSKKKLENQYFKITNSNGLFSIEQYFGLILPTSKMNQNNWYKHPYLANYINDEYPIFDIHDFESTNGVSITKKSDNTKIKDELLEYSNYFLMNPKLSVTIKSIKQFLTLLKIDFKNFTDFSNLYEYTIKYINSLTISNLDKTNYLIIFFQNVNDFYLIIESLNIEQPRTFINNKFKYLFLLINENAIN